MVSKEEVQRYLGPEAAGVWEEACKWCCAPRPYGAPRWALEIYARISGRVFIRAWCRLAAEGACDARGGAEFHRVSEEWLDASMPGEVEDFIRARAR